MWRGVVVTNEEWIAVGSNQVVPCLLPQLIENQSSLSLVAGNTVDELIVKSAVMMLMMERRVLVKNQHKQSRVDEVPSRLRKCPVIKVINDDDNLKSTARQGECCDLRTACR